VSNKHRGSTGCENTPCGGALGRREVLKLAGTATAAALAGCEGSVSVPDQDLGAGPDMPGGGADLAGPCAGTPADGAETLAVGQAMSFPNPNNRNLSFIVARDAQGFYALRNVCTHLGCNTAFNSVTREFECPCHGSRYNFDGTLKNGPAPLPLRVFPICRDIDNKLLVDTSSPSDDLARRLPP
jgi:Rieske Fe-S protein